MAMRGIASAIPARRQQQSFGLSAIQTVLLTLLLGIGIPLLSFTVTVELFNTLLIFIAVTLFGLWLCHRTHVYLGDPKLKILLTFWLLKVNATLFLLYIGWIPQLDPSSVSWGYDPQRYFQDAWTLIENGWNPSIGSNYQGIIFFYGAIFYLFGHNPVIPALINTLVTLLGTLFLIRSVYSFMSDRKTKDWTIAGLLLVPEMLWYDVMTSRETLMAVLIIISVLSVGRYFVGMRNVSLVKTLLLSGTALFAILAVRTTMAVPVILSISLMVQLLKTKRTFSLLQKLLVFGIAIAGVSAGEFIQQITGGQQSFDYSQAIASGFTFETNVAALNQWSDNSIGLLIAPNNAWESVLYLPLRMVLYLAAPLPNIVVSVNELISGSWGAWQSLMTIPTSFMMLLGLPFALAGASYSWRVRSYQPAPMALHITFWITFMAVAGGTFSLEAS